MRNAPALGFKQQYAIGNEEEIEDGEGMTSNPTPEHETDGLETLEDQVEMIENASPEELAAHAEEVVEHGAAVQNDLLDKLVEATQDNTEIAETLAENAAKCAEHDDNVPTGRMYAFKQVRLKHLHRRIAALKAKLGARIQPYARPARHFSARVSASPGSASRLARRMQRTRF